MILLFIYTNIINTKEKLLNKICWIIPKKTIKGNKLGMNGMKKLNFRIISVILSIITTILTFVISYVTLSGYNQDFIIILIFLALMFSLFGVLIVFILTRKE